MYGIPVFDSVEEAKEREKDQIRGLFERYVAPSVVEKLMVRPETVQLGGVRQDATVLFADIRGFSDYSVKATPEDLVDVLNAGSLPTALKNNPIWESKSGPTLGRDTIRRGAYSIGLSLVVVLVFTENTHQHRAALVDAVIDRQGLHGLGLPPHRLAIGGRAEEQGAKPAVGHLPGIIEDLGQLRAAALLEQGKFLLREAGGLHHLC